MCTEFIVFSILCVYILCQIFRLGVAFAIFYTVMHTTIAHEIGISGFRNILILGISNSSELCSFLGLCGFCNEWYHYFDYPAWESSCHFLERNVTFRFSFFFFFSNLLFCCRCHNEVKYISDVPFLLVHTSLGDLSLCFGLVFRNSLLQNYIFI